MTKYLKQFLKAINVDLKLVEPLLDENLEDLPEDFNLEEAAQAHLNNQKDVLTKDLREELEKSRDDEFKEREKELYAKIVNPIKSRLKKEANLEYDKSIKELNLEDVVKDFVKAKAKEAESSDDEVKTALRESREKLSTALEELQDMKLQVEKTEEEKIAFQKSIEDELRSEKIVDEALDRVPWAIKGDALVREKRNIKRDLEGFTVTPERKILDDSGAPVIKFDKTGKFDTVDDYIDAYTERYGLRKKSKDEDDLPGPDELSKDRYKQYAGDDPEKIKKMKKIDEHMAELEKQLGEKEVAK